jgi:hypothetical protein
VVGVPDVRAGFHGGDATGLGEGWWPRAREQAEESAERLWAASNLAECRRHDGKYVKAERINREVLGVQRRVLGEEHPEMLSSANNLAISLSDQGKEADA